MRDTTNDVTKKKPAHTKKAPATTKKESVVSAKPLASAPKNSDMMTPTGKKQMRNMADTQGVSNMKDMLFEKKPKLGSGKRFDNLVNKLDGKKGVSYPAALAASIGRKKLGKDKFQKLAADGKKKGN